MASLPMTERRSCLAAVMSCLAAVMTAIGWRAAMAVVLLVGTSLSASVFSDTLRGYPWFWALGMAVIAGGWMAFGAFPYGIKDICLSDSGRASLPWPYASTIWTRWDVPVFVGLFLAGANGPLWWIAAAVLLRVTGVQARFAGWLSRRSWVEASRRVIAWWTPRLAVVAVLAVNLGVSVFRAVSSGTGGGVPGVVPNPYLGAIATAIGFFVASRFDFNGSDGERLREWDFVSYDRGSILTVWWGTMFPRHDLVVFWEKATDDTLAVMYATHWDKASDRRFISGGVGDWSESRQEIWVQVNGTYRVEPGRVREMVGRLPHEAVKQLESFADPDVRLGSSPPYERGDLLQVEGDYWLAVYWGEETNGDRRIFSADREDRTGDERFVSIGQRFASNEVGDWPESRQEIWVQVNGTYRVEPGRVWKMVGRLPYEAVKQLESEADPDVELSWPPPYERGDLLQAEGVYELAVYWGEEVDDLRVLYIDRKDRAGDERFMSVDTAVWGMREQEIAVQVTGVHRIPRNSVRARRGRLAGEDLVRLQSVVDEDVEISWPPTDYERGEVLWALIPFDDIPDEKDRTVVFWEQYPDGWLGVVWLTSQSPDEWEEANFLYLGRGEWSSDESWARIKKITIIRPGVVRKRAGILRPGMMKELERAVKF